MANKKLIEDLRTLANFTTHEGFEDDFVRDVAARALEEIAYLQSQLDYQIQCRASDAAWADFKLGDMK